MSSRVHVARVCCWVVRGFPRSVFRKTRTIVAPVKNVGVSERAFSVPVLLFVGALV
jgi:hypothetical protein